MSERDPKAEAAILARKARNDATAMRELAEVVALTEHAVPMRYDEMLDAEPLDRDATVALVDKLSRWATAQFSMAMGEADDDDGGEETQEEPS